MMNFTHHTGGPLKIPGPNAIKQRVMKMGEDTIDGVREMLSVRYYSHFSLFIMREEA